MIPDGTRVGEIKTYFDLHHMEWVECEWDGDFWIERKRWEQEGA